MTHPNPHPGPPSPQLHVLGRRFRDFDELAETIHGWGLDWVQLDRGPLDAAIQQVATATAQLSRFRFSRTFHQRGTTPPGVRTFGLVGERSPEVEWRGSTGTKTHILAFPADDLFQVISRPGFHGDTVSIPEDRIRSVAESMGFPDPLEGLSGGLAFVDVDRHRQSVLRRAISGLHAMVTDSADKALDPTVVSEVESEIVTALVAALQSSRPFGGAPREPRTRTRAMRRALDYIEAHADAPPRVEEICRASGASWRTLNYAFRERFGVTPKHYLHAYRLQKVRRAIVNAEPSQAISEVAAHWGFWHMGQFAADYRRQFGELPSETHRRAS